MVVHIFETEFYLVCNGFGIPECRISSDICTYSKFSLALVLVSK